LLETSIPLTTKIAGFLDVNIMKTAKIFISPVNEIISDALIEVKRKGVECGVILSKRQHNNQFGYVPRQVIKQIKKSGLLLERDHFCFESGKFNLEEIVYDSNFFDIVHIDPWFYGDFNMDDFIKMHESFSVLNPSLKYEIGTEEYIKKIDTKDLRLLLNSIDTSNVTYLICQGGSEVFDLQNISKIDEFKTKEFVDLAKQFGVKSKRHNCDFHSLDELNKLSKLGVDAFNFAPEFSTIFNEVVYQSLNKKQIDSLKNVLINSTPWNRWIKSAENTKKLFASCLHYIQDELVLEKANFFKKEITEKIIDKIVSINGAIND
jgi:hypothetical protein